jgi:hypothetical protein
MDTIQFFLLHHARLTTQIEDHFGQLTDDQMRVRPHPLMNSIAWLLWHSACGEDMLNVLLVNHSLLLDESDWLRRLKLARRDVGTGMTTEQVSEFSDKVDIESLRSYHAAVGKRTENIAQDLRLEQLNEVPDPSQVHQLFHEGGIFGPQASAGEQFYAGKTKGWFLGHLGLTHPREHFAQAIIVRKMLGLGSGRR